MTTFSGAAGADPDETSHARWGCGSRMRWKPIEIAAVVLGFAIYWPIGLAILGLKIAQRRGYIFDDAANAMREKFGGFGRQSGGRDAQWRPFSSGGSGNTAFDDWRKAELERLEEERRKLDAAHREFAEYMNNLRRAKDREEFDRFMNSRNAGQGSSNPA